MNKKNTKTVMTTHSSDIDEYIKELEERVEFLEERAHSSCRFSCSQVKSHTPDGDLEEPMTYNFYIGLILIAKGTKQPKWGDDHSNGMHFCLHWLCHHNKAEFHETLQEMKEAVVQTIWEM